MQSWQPMKHIPCVAAVRIAHPAAADCAAPDAITAVLVVEALALMIAADVVEPVLVTVKGPVLEVVALRAEELAGETGAQVTAQRHAEWIAQGHVLEVAPEDVCRIVQRAALLAVKVAVERKLG